MNILKNLLTFFLWGFIVLWFLILSVPGFIAGMIYYPLVNGFIWADKLFSYQLQSKYEKNELEKIEIYKAMIKKENKSNGK